MLNKIILEDLQYITNQALEWEQFKNKTVLISGASGFLASYMIETLLYLNEIKQLNIKVIGLVRNIEAANLKYKHHKFNMNFLLIKQDVCKEFRLGYKVDYIFHMASNATPKLFTSDPVGTILPNVVGTINLLNLAKENNIKTFLYFSTSGVYGNIDRSIPLLENDFGGLDPIDVSSCYLESKKMGENICVSYMQQFNITIKIVRPSINYGPGVDLNDGRSYADFINSIVNKKDIILTSDGQTYRNFCYVADTILGFFIVLLKGNNGEAYNVATEEEIKIIDLANLLTQKLYPELNLKVIIDKSFTNYLRKEFTRTAMNIDKIKKLGWNTNYNVEEGFKRTIDSYKETL